MGGGGGVIAGADIKEMKDKTFADVYGNNFLENWSLITKIQKPIIAAVSGFAVSPLASPSLVYPHVLLFFFVFFYSSVEA